MLRSKSTPNTYLPSNTLNVLKAKYKTLQRLPKIDVSRVIYDNYAHTRSISQARAAATLEIAHHYRQFTQDLQRVEHDKSLSLKRSSFTPPARKKIVVKYHFDGGISTSDA